MIMRLFGEQSKKDVNNLMKTLNNNEKEHSTDTVVINICAKMICHL